MEFKIAKTAEDVYNAWRLIYDKYLSSGLIKPNEYKLFTYPETIHKDTIITIGAEQDGIQATVSFTSDINNVPLDKVFKEEIDKIRVNNKIYEIGLFASNIEKVSLEEIIEIFTIPLCYFFDNQFTAVCGVRPNKEKIYKKIFGFKRISDIKNYNKNEYDPCILMSLDKKDIPSSIINYLIDNPINVNFDERFDFSEEKIKGSMIEEYIKKELNILGQDGDK